MFDQITNPKMCESKQIYKVILVRDITGSDIQSYDGLFMCTANLQEASRSKIKITL